MTIVYNNKMLQSSTNVCRKPVNHPHSAFLNLFIWIDIATFCHWPVLRRERQRCVKTPTIAEHSVALRRRNSFINYRGQLGGGCDAMPAAHARDPPANRAWSTQSLFILEYSNSKSYYYWWTRAINGRVHLVLSTQCLSFNQSIILPFMIWCWYLILALQVHTTKQLLWNLKILF